MDPVPVFDASARIEAASEPEGNRSYRLACVLVAIAVTALFTWQPWNSNGDAVLHPVQPPPAAGAER